MVFDPEVRLGFIGCGRMARNHINGILQGFQNTSIEIVCEPSEDSYSETKKIFESNGRQVPLNIPDIQEFLNSYASIRCSNDSYTACDASRSCNCLYECGTRCAN